MPKYSHPSYIAALHAAGITGTVEQDPRTLRQAQQDKRARRYRTRWIEVLFREQRHEAIARKQARVAS